MPQPLISVVMPMFNARRYVGSALESILAQTLGDFELLALDDGSTDDTAEIVAKIAERDLRVKLIRLANRGGTATMSAGVERATGEFIARFDADDLSLPERFEKQIAFLRANPDYVAVGSAVLIIDPEGRPLRRAIWPTTHEASDKALLHGDNNGGLPHPAAMIRTAAMRQVGGYRDRFPVSQDKDLYLRLGEIGKLLNLPEILLQYRTHESSVGSTRAATQREAFETAIRDAAKRRGIEVPVNRTVAPIHASWLSFSEPNARWAVEAIGGCYFGSARHHAMKHWTGHPLSPRAWGLLGLTLAAPVIQMLRGKIR